MFFAGFGAASARKIEGFENQNPGSPYKYIDITIISGYAKITYTFN
jgi:hypothetical protein